MAMGWTAAVRFLAGSWQFSLHHNVQSGSVAHPSSYAVVPGDFTLGIERPGREAYHSPPSSSGFRMVELYLHSPPPPRVFMAPCLIKHMENHKTLKNASSNKLFGAVVKFETTVCGGSLFVPGGDPIFSIVFHNSST